MTDKIEQKNTNKPYAGNAHDTFFRELFESEKTVTALLGLALTEEQLAPLDLDAVQLERRSWPAKDGLGGSRADLVVSARLKAGGEVAVQFVCEHKSHPDSQLMLQLLKYQAHLYVHQSAAAVVPILVYHGRRKGWPAWRTFQQQRMSRLPADFVSQFSPCLLDFGMLVLNLHDEAVKNQLSALPLDIRLSLEAMAGIWQADEDVFVDLLIRSRQLPDRLRVAVMSPIANYLIRVHRRITIGTLTQRVNERIEGDTVMQRLSDSWIMMSKEELREQIKLYYYYEGKGDGEENHAIETARRMINLGFTDAQISKSVALPVGQIEDLRKSS